MSFLANLFGYLLNALYNLFNNYGIAIIVFSVIIRLLLMPITIKQQETLKKNSEMQEELKKIQDKYKNDAERMNQEIIEFYKTSGTSPFSGCLSSILQMFIILAVFYLVKSPLTYMKKVDPEIINNYSNEIMQETGQKSAYQEIEIINKKSEVDESVRINMNFLGVDLSKIPTNNIKDWKVFIIPVLYVISSFVSIKLTTKLQEETMKKDEKDIIIINDDKENNKDEELSQEEMTRRLNKQMTYMLPIMSISIALIAPLGLALYWLVSNILMIIERLLIHFFMKPKEEN